MKSIRARHALPTGFAIMLSACASIIPQAAIAGGQHVADRLNARYLNTVPDCHREPAFTCSGLMVRVLSPFGDVQPLDPTPVQIARNGVSFSYLRKDLGITRLYQLGWAGYVVAMDNPRGAEPLVARCSFPVDAYTDSRPDSCGISDRDMTPVRESQPCAQQGIGSPGEWGQYFSAITDERFSCSFDTSVIGFRISLESRNLIPQDSNRHFEWNEVVLAPWKQEDVQHLPVEAVFYSGLQEDMLPIERVHQHQCRIYFATKRRVPLLHLQLDDPEQPVFRFNQADQIDFDAATPACVYPKVSTA
ncbi:hypothetical protein D3C77_291240 [compost metagenome]